MDGNLKTRGIRILGFALALLNAVHADEPSAAAGHWPEWRGAARDNISTDTDLLKKWPPGGPPLRWKTLGLGAGIASVSVAHGRIYTVGYHDGHEFLTALVEETGERAWVERIGPAVRESSLMRWLSQRTPTVDRELLYVMTAYGELRCHRVADGGKVWVKSYREEFGSKKPLWGFCDYPLVDGERLICTPGGPLTTIVALDKKNGEVIWKSAPLGPEHPSYAAVVVAETGGIRHYVSYLRDGLVGVSASGGELLWSYDRLATKTNSLTPVVRDDLVLCLNAVQGRQGAALLKLAAVDGGVRAEEQRFLEAVRTDYFQDSTVVVSGDLYTLRRAGIPLCVSLRTGETAWIKRNTRGGSGRAAMTCADGRLYLRYSNGVVILVEATPEDYRERGSFSIPDHEGSTSGATHPVVTGGRLYLRDEEKLFCYDVTAGALRAPPPEPRTTVLEFPTVEAGKEVVGRGQGRSGRGFDSVFVPTPQDIVEKMLAVAAVDRADVVYDLGCGDGRIVLTAARDHGSRAVGYEIDPDLVEIARDRVRDEELENLVAVEKKDLFTVELGGASVVTLYLLPEVNAKLVPQLKKLKAGSRIVAHQHAIPGIRPDRVVRMVSREDAAEHTIYLWTAPLRESEAE